MNPAQGRFWRLRLAALLDGRSGGELIPNLATRGLPQPSELEQRKADRPPKRSSGRMLTSRVKNGDHGGLYRLGLHHSPALLRALTSLGPADRRTSSGFGPVAAPGLVFLGERIQPASAGADGSRSLRGSPPCPRPWGRPRLSSPPATSPW